MATDKAIQQTLRTAFKDVTMLVVAHRLSTIMDLDWILVMDKGKIVEQGSPQELLQLRGRFTELARDRQDRTD